MSKVNILQLELDDRTAEQKKEDEEEEQNRRQYGMGYSDKDKTPMDTSITADHGKLRKEVQLNMEFMNELQGFPDSSKQQDRTGFKKLFDAVSSGDPTKLEYLKEELCKNNKTLTSSDYCPNGITALMKALLNLKNEKTEIVHKLLDIAEKQNDLKKLVTAAYTDPYFKGQTALHIAIERQSKYFANLLLNKEADIHARACGKFFQPHGKTCFYFGELPLSLAACTNQKEMVDLLLEKNANIRERDSLGNTVLHALVIVADNTPENTNFITYMYNYMLIKDASLPRTEKPEVEKLEDILNNDGFTSIKLAAKLGKIGIFKNILHREFHQEESVHLSRKFTEWTYGPVYAALYDLTSLDSSEENSVLETLVYGTEIPNRLDMLQIEPLNNLLEDKWTRFGRQLFFLKSIFYIIYVLVFTVFAYNDEGTALPFQSRNASDICMQLFLTIGALYFFIVEIFNIKRRLPSLQMLLEDGYFDLLFFFQAQLFLIFAILYYAQSQCYVAFLVLSLALGWLNLLYFFRGSKKLGIYNVMIQRMILGDLLRFCLVYMILLIGFSTAVVTILTPLEENNKEGLNNTEITKLSEDPKTDFKNMYSTTLELFKLTIGMGELEFTEQYRYKLVYYLLVVSYIVLTYILLLNMLIALMSKSVEKLSEQSINIWNLQRAITILDLEKSVLMISKYIKNKLRSGIRKNLGKEDWRWCLRVDEMNWNQWNHNICVITEEPGDERWCITNTLSQSESNSEIHQKPEETIALV